MLVMASKYDTYRLVITGYIITKFLKCYNSTL